MIVVFLESGAPRDLHRVERRQRQMCIRDGDVNDVGDAAQTAQGQLTAHPAWGLARRDVADIMANVARAEILGLDADGQARINIVADRVVAVSYTHLTLPTIYSV